MKNYILRISPSEWAYDKFKVLVHIVWEMFQSSVTHIIFTIYFQRKEVLLTTSTTMMRWYMTKANQSKWSKKNQPPPPPPPPLQPPPLPQQLLPQQLKPKEGSIQSEINIKCLLCACVCGG